MKCALRLLVCASAGMFVGLGACGTADSPSPNGAGGATNSGQGGSASGLGGASSAIGGAAGLGGTTGSGGSAGGNGAGGATTGPGGGPPALTVDGNHLRDSAGNTVVLRGSSLIDIGSLYMFGGQSAAGISNRLDKVAAAGVQGHVVRMPVYPLITYNGGSPTCSPLPYPVGTGPSATCTPKMPLNAADYVSRVLKPAVDYATGKGLYVIIDFHQIDNASTGTSAADARTFWTDIAPRFANYTNVFYELFNEPIDNKVPWSTLKPVVQGLVDVVRAAAPQNIIVIPSNSWDQHTGDAVTDPPRGSNFMYTAHIYPANWNQAFQTQVATAVASAPVFVTEWGYAATDPNPHAWGTALQATIDADGASWTAWVTDNGWSPPMFTSTALTALTDFGTLVKSWLASKGP
jgi:endoglucanase